MDASPQPVHDETLIWRDAALWSRWPWLASRIVGVVLGLAGVLLVTAVVWWLEGRQMGFLTASLPFAVIVLAIGYGWGWRAGFVVAVGAFVALWYALSSPPLSWSTTRPSEWTRLLLVGVIYVMLAFAGGALRRARRANAELARAVNRLNAIIGSIADGVIVLDRDGLVVQSNDAMQRIAGEMIARREERILRWRLRYPDGTRITADRGPLADALRGRVVHEQEVVIQAASGRDVPLSVSSAPLRERGGEIVGAVLVCRDISELRRLQQAKDAFLSVASHELRTPLTTLHGYAYLMGQRLQLLEIGDERMRRYVETMQRQTNRMTELVETLLDVSRIDAGRLTLRYESCDLAALVREVVEPLRDLSNRHEIRLALAAPVPGRWDRDRIEQVIVNLLTNAFRYSPDGGPVDVVLHQQPAAADRPASAVLRVQDRGLGLTPEQQTLIFERFQQAHEDDVMGYTAGRTGMGLGLYISREIVERHGGRIWAESAGPGQGASFVVTLPLKPPGER
ncbi:MAG: ATP-binding protein [Thermomicrobiales bacterium]